MAAACMACLGRSRRAQQPPGASYHQLPHQQQHPHGYDRPDQYHPNVYLYAQPQQYGQDPTPDRPPNWAHRDQGMQASPTHGRTSTAHTGSGPGPEQYHRPMGPSPGASPARRHPGAAHGPMSPILAGGPPGAARSPRLTEWDQGGDGGHMGARPRHDSTGSGPRHSSMYDHGASPRQQQQLYNAQYGDAMAGLEYDTYGVSPGRQYRVTSVEEGSFPHVREDGRATIEPRSPHNGPPTDRQEYAPVHQSNMPYRAPAGGGERGCWPLPCFSTHASDSPEYSYLGNQPAAMMPPDGHHHYAQTYDTPRARGSSVAAAAAAAAAAACVPGASPGGYRDPRVVQYENRLYERGEAPPWSGPVGEHFGGRELEAAIASGAIGQRNSAMAAAGGSVASGGGSGDSGGPRTRTRPRMVSNKKTQADLEDDEGDGGAAPDASSTAGTADCGSSVAGTETGAAPGGALLLLPSQAGRGPAHQPQYRSQGPPAHRQQAAGAARHHASAAEDPRQDRAASPGPPHSRGASASPGPPRASRPPPPLSTYREDGSDDDTASESTPRMQPQEARRAVVMALPQGAGRAPGPARDPRVGEGAAAPQQLPRRLGSGGAGRSPSRLRYVSLDSQAGLGHAGMAVARPAPGRPARSPSTSPPPRAGASDVQSVEVEPSLTGYAAARRSAASRRGTTHTARQGPRIIAAAPAQDRGSGSEAGEQESDGAEAEAVEAVGDERYVAELLRQVNSLLSDMRGREADREGGGPRSDRRTPSPGPRAVQQAGGTAEAMAPSRRLSHTVLAGAEPPAVRASLTAASAAAAAEAAQAAAMAASARANALLGSNRRPSYTSIPPDANRTSRTNLLEPPQSPALLSTPLPPLPSAYTLPLPTSDGLPANCGISDIGRHVEEATRATLGRLASHASPQSPRTASTGAAAFTGGPYGSYGTHVYGSPGGSAGGPAAPAPRPSAFDMLVGGGSVCTGDVDLDREYRELVEEGGRGRGMSSGSARPATAQSYVHRQPSSPSRQQHAQQAHSLSRQPSFQGPQFSSPARSSEAVAGYGAPARPYSPSRLSAPGIPSVHTELSGGHQYVTFDNPLAEDEQEVAYAAYQPYPPEAGYRPGSQQVAPASPRRPAPSRTPTRTPRTGRSVGGNSGDTRGTALLSDVLFSSLAPDLAWEVASALGGVGLDTRVTFGADEDEEEGEEEEEEELYAPPPQPAGSVYHSGMHHQQRHSQLQPARQGGPQRPSGAYHVLPYGGESGGVYDRSGGAMEHAAMAAPEPHHDMVEPQMMAYARQPLPTMGYGTSSGGAAAALGSPLSRGSAFVGGGEGSSQSPRYTAALPSGGAAAIATGSDERSLGYTATGGAMAYAPAPTAAAAALVGAAAPAQAELGRQPDTAAAASGRPRENSVVTLSERLRSLATMASDAATRLQSFAPRLGSAPPSPPPPAPATADADASNASDGSAADEEHRRHAEPLADSAFTTPYHPYSRPMSPSLSSLTEGQAPPAEQGRPPAPAPRGGVALPAPIPVRQVTAYSEPSFAPPMPMAPGPLVGFLSTPPLDMLGSGGGGGGHVGLYDFASGSSIGGAPAAKAPSERSVSQPPTPPHAAQSPGRGGAFPRLPDPVAAHAVHSPGALRRHTVAAAADHAGSHAGAAAAAAAAVAAGQLTAAQLRGLMAAAEMSAGGQGVGPAGRW